MNPYTLAKDGLVHYSGDYHPLSEGGYWYDSSTWESDGYASCVDVWVDDDAPSGARVIHISRLVINKPLDMSRAFRYSDVSESDRDNILVQIEVCKQFGHTDPDESDWREPSLYSFLVPDYAEKASDFEDYLRIHGYALALDDTPIETLLTKIVGRELYQG